MKKSRFLMEYERLRQMVFREYLMSSLKSTADLLQIIGLEAPEIIRRLDILGGILERAIQKSGDKIFKDFVARFISDCQVSKK